MPLFEREYQQSARGIITGTVKGSIRDATKAASQASDVVKRGGALITGERPDDVSPTSWWIQKNAVRIGVGLIGVAVLAYVFRPYFKAADRMIRRG